MRFARVSILSLLLAHTEGNGGLRIGSLDEKNDAVRLVIIESGTNTLSFLDRS